MSDAELERLIKDWYRQAESRDPPAPSRQCLPITRLWRHVTMGDGLGGNEEHVASCDRCRRLCEIIEREHIISVLADSSAGRPRRMVYAVSGLTALAAWLALAVFSWPRPSFDAEVALFCQAVYSIGDPATLRGGDDPRADAVQSDVPDWLAQALADPQVQAALEEQNRITMRIVQHLKYGRLRIDNDDGLVLGPGVGDLNTRARLNELIEREREAKAGIVEVLVRRIPDASNGDLPELQRLLDQYRARKTFGHSD